MSTEEAKLRIISAGKTKSISDDDLCARCIHCGYQPGELSTCSEGWPGATDDDGYVVTCSAETC